MRSHSRSVECAVTHERRAETVQEIVNVPRPELDSETKERFQKATVAATRNGKLANNTKNPSVKQGQYSSGGTIKSSSNRRYFAATDDSGHWPPQLNDYNKRVTAALEKIKRRHDAVVTTIGRSSTSSHSPRRVR